MCMHLYLVMNAYKLGSRALRRTMSLVQVKETAAASQLAKQLPAELRAAQMSSRSIHPVDIGFVGIVVVVVVEWSAAVSLESRG